MHVEFPVPPDMIESKPVCWLPANGNNTFYLNYTDSVGAQNLSARRTYYYYEGELFWSGGATQHNTNGYAEARLAYSNNSCIDTDNFYHMPELREVIFPLLSIVCAGAIFYLAYKLILSRFWRRLR